MEIENTKNCEICRVEINIALSEIIFCILKRYIPHSALQHVVDPVLRTKICISELKNINMPELSKSVHELRKFRNALEHGKRITYYIYEDILFHARTLHSFFITDFQENYDKTEKLVHILEQHITSDHQGNTKSNNQENIKLDDSSMLIKQKISQNIAPVNVKTSENQDGMSKYDLDLTLHDAKRLYYLKMKDRRIQILDGKHTGKYGIFKGWNGTVAKIKLDGSQYPISLAMNRKIRAQGLGIFNL